MATEPAPTEPKKTPEQEANLKALSDKTFPEPKKLVANVQFPNALVARDGEHFTIRNGGTPQVELEVEEWLTFDKKESEDYPMRVRKTSPLIVAGRTIQVLDDKSIPTAGDYLAQIGKRTLWDYGAKEIPANPGQLSAVYGRTVYHCRRVWVVIPEKT